MANEDYYIMTLKYRKDVMKKLIEVTEQQLLFYADLIRFTMNLDEYEDTKLSVRLKDLNTAYIGTLGEIVEQIQQIR